MEPCCLWNIIAYVSNTSRPLTLLGHEFPLLYFYFSSGSSIFNCLSKYVKKSSNFVNKHVPLICCLQILSVLVKSSASWALASSGLASIAVKEAMSPCWTSYHSSLPSSICLGFLPFLSSRNLTHSGWAFSLMTWVNALWAAVHLSISAQQQSVSDYLLTRRTKAALHLITDTEETGRWIILLWVYGGGRRVRGASINSVCHLSIVEHRVIKPLLDLIWPEDPDETSSKRIKDVRIWGQMVKAWRSGVNLTQKCWRSAAVVPPVLIIIW